MTIHRFLGQPGDVVRERLGRQRHEDFPQVFGCRRSAMALREMPASNSRMGRELRNPGRYQGLTVDDNKFSAARLRFLRSLRMLWLLTRTTHATASG